uniref:G_PROTEIN_RECEP_F1_2 domain-containing protein n=1 Tax=Strongyloides papillosus TaxID=174720 RepID=A0A0N5BC35_STREA
MNANMKAVMPIDSMSQCTHIKDHRYSCINNTIEINILNIYPHIPEIKSRFLINIGVFCFCFIVGICGNSSILTIIRSVISKRNPGRLNRRQKDYAIFYIISLCVVDMIMLMSLPTCILDLIIGFWLFGTWICKIHHISSSVGRVISTFLITAMSFDRYMAVCHPLKLTYRSKKFVILTCISAAFLALILLSPLLGYAQSIEILHGQFEQYDDKLGIYNVTRVRFFKCIDNMPVNVAFLFTISTFTLGFLIPLVLIVFFNVQIISRLYRHTKVLPTSGIPLLRISLYTILIAVLYFICWTPYWITNIYSFFTSVDSETKHQELLTFIMYCVHGLPYVGCASNWILYGLLNTQLQVKQRTNITNNNTNNNNFQQQSLRLDCNTGNVEKSSTYQL